MLNHYNGPDADMIIVSLRLRLALTALCVLRGGFSPIAWLFVLSAERRKGRVHGHLVRGGLRLGEACGDWTPGARPARSHSGTEMEARKQDCGEK